MFDNNSARPLRVKLEKEELVGLVLVVLLSDPGYIYYSDLTLFSQHKSSNVIAMIDRHLSGGLF